VAAPLAVHLRAQRWQAKLRSIGGATALQSAAQSVVSVVGGGQGLIAPQYVAPSTAAARQPQQVPPRPKEKADGSSSSETLEQAANGLPRGADMYSAVYDGVPAARMEPPASARPRAPQR
jgi:hypothetical protein